MKVIKFISILFLLFFCSAIVVAEKYSVTAETLNVRQRASSKSEVLFKLSKGDIVESNDHGKWMEIDYNGQKGYAYSKYLKKVDAESSSSYNDNSISWLPIIWMTLPLVIFIAILFWLHKYYRWPSLFMAIFLSLLFIVIVSPVTKFLFGLFGYETIGKYVGWVITILLVCGAFGSNTRKAEKEDSTTNTPTRDVDDCPPSYLDSEDYSHSSSEHHYNNDFNNEYEDQDSNYDDYEDRRSEYEEERQRREDEYEDMRRQDLSYKAESAKSEYEYYQRLADESKQTAETYLSRARSCEERAREYDDESYERESQDNYNKAEIYVDEAESYQRKADDAYETWRYNEKQL